MSQKKLPAGDVLLSRDAFKVAVFARDNGKCVFCGKAAVDPHHILERDLFPDEGYYLGNGASVCADDHLKCERSLYTVEQVRVACGITAKILPPGFSADKIYDKWGNELLNGTVIAGPMFSRAGTQKAMKEGGIRLWEVIQPL